MNSSGVLSPKLRDADTLVAGNALGTMLIEARFRGEAMTREAIDTMASHVLVNRAVRDGVYCGRTSVLIPEIDGGARLVGPAAHDTHIGDEETVGPSPFPGERS